MCKLWRDPKGKLVKNGGDGEGDRLGGLKGNLYVYRASRNRKEVRRVWIVYAGTTGEKGWQREAEAGE